MLEDKDERSPIAPIGDCFCMHGGGALIGGLFEVSWQWSVNFCLFC